MAGKKKRGSFGYKYTPGKVRDLPPMNTILQVGIQSGNIIWDDVADGLGHVYDHACYNADLERQRKQSDITNLTIIGGPVEQVVEFDAEVECESCFMKGKGRHELRVKDNKVYCPNCLSTRRRLS